jgi:FKBP-type peptidyl-prolyl cis-trans isomerase FklB
MKLFLTALVCFALTIAAADAQDTKEPAKGEPAKKEPAKKEPAKKEPAKEEPAKEDDGGLKTLSDKVSYGIGLNFGSQLRQNGVGVEDVNLKIIVEAMFDAMGKKKHRLTEAQLRAAFEEFGKQMAAKAEAEKKALPAKNRKEGAAYLAANAKKPGVVTTKSGLQYKALKAGTGKTPTTKDSVKAHYRGTLIDGTQFDSSYDRGRPSSFKVTGVIKGWTEALQLMKVGAKWQLVIPSELAYGANPPGSTIGPDAVLIFEIELVEIEK